MCVFAYIHKDDMFNRFLNTYRSSMSMHPVLNVSFSIGRHKVVIVEGNYLFLEEGLWQDICSIFDEKW